MTKKCGNNDILLWVFLPISSGKNQLFQKNKISKHKNLGLTKVSDKNISKYKMNKR